MGYGLAIVWVVSDVHYQTPAHLEKVWVGFTVTGMEKMSNQLLADILFYSFDLCSVEID